MTVAQADNIHQLAGHLFRRESGKMGDPGTALMMQHLPGIAGGEARTCSSLHLYNGNC
jgi:hypothetical protein